MFKMTSTGKSVPNSKRDQRQLAILGRKPINITKTELFIHD